MFPDNLHVHLTIALNKIPSLVGFSTIRTFFDSFHTMPPVKFPPSGSVVKLSVSFSIRESTSSLIVASNFLLQEIQLLLGVSGEKVIRRHNNANVNSGLFPVGKT